MKCPFMPAQKVIDNSEPTLIVPAYTTAPRDCLLHDCAVFDAGRGLCALVSIPDELRELRERLREIEIARHR